MLGFISSCVGSRTLLTRAGAALAGRILQYVEMWAERLTELDWESSLVHGDFNGANILVRSLGGTWGAAAVLDWEYAFSGSHLFDIGNFLRYERAEHPLVEPHFSLGFTRAGGRLRENWRNISRAVDLTALCEMLTRETLPDEIVAELLELICATLDGRDPQ